MKSILALCLLATFLSIPAFGSDSIRIWTRVPGDFIDGNIPAPKNETTVQLSDLKTETKHLFDFQLGESADFKVIHLNEILREKLAGSNCDMVLLHFANRMIVPITKQLAKSLDPELAIWLAVATRNGDDSKWSNQFPPIARKDEKYSDPNPTKFDRNKIIIGQAWRPAKRDPKDAFSYWKHVSSLVGIELVDQRAYEKQFLPIEKKKQTSKEGWQVFLTRCQYCHGARLVGAGYGWDFVTPLPIYEKRSVESLFVHVQVPKLEKIEMGIHMPHQPDFTEAEARNLWQWLRSIAKGKLEKYEPAR